MLILQQLLSIGGKRHYHTVLRWCSWYVVGVRSSLADAAAAAAVTKDGRESLNSCTSYYVPNSYLRRSSTILRIDVQSGWRVGIVLYYIS